MVPERPLGVIMLGLGLRSDHPYSASCPLISSQLNSICVQIGRPFVVVRGGAGALSGDVWILSWGGVRVGVE
jgi:hypothetical protein